MLVPSRARAEHFKHHPRVRVVMWLHQVHENASGLGEGTLTHGLQLRLSFLTPVESRLDGDHEEERALLIADRSFVPRGSTGEPRSGIGNAGGPGTIMMSRGRPPPRPALCGGAGVHRSRRVRRRGCSLSSGKRSSTWSGSAEAGRWPHTRVAAPQTSRSVAPGLASQ